MTSSEPVFKRMDSNGRYAQAVLVGGHLHIGGQLAYDARHGDIGAQAGEILGRVDGYLSRSGLSRRHLVMVQVFFNSRDDYDGFNAVWDRWIPDDAAPARVCVVAPLILDGYRIEVTATARIVAEAGR